LLPGELKKPPSCHCASPGRANGSVASENSACGRR